VKVVCTTCCYRGLERDELTETLEGAPQAGYTYIDVHRVPVPEEPEAARAYGQEVRAQCLASGLDPVGIHCVGFGGRDVAHLEAQTKRIATQIAFCLGLGGTTVVSTGAHRRGEGPLENVIECLRRLEPVIEGTPIKIGLEPHYRNVVEQAEDYDAIFAAIGHPQIGLCPDIGHFHASGVDVYDLLDRYAKRIFHTHVKDHIGTQSVGIGHGEIDIPRFVRALAEIGYDGCLAVELEHKDKEHTQRYVEEARVLLDRALSAV
jgi:sugar phosphate isomerase/epimerase